MDYAKDLKILVDKAYLQTAAHDQMAFTQYLSQIDNVQVAFSVKQQKPATLGAAVSATLEMETYLGPKIEVTRVEEHIETVAVTTTDETTHVMKKLLHRMDRLEMELTAAHKEKEESKVQRRKPLQQQSNPSSRSGGRRNITCWNCSRKGHIVRDCLNQPYQGNQGSRPYQGNRRPSVDRANH